MSKRIKLDPRPARSAVLTSREVANALEPQVGYTVGSLRNVETVRYLLRLSADTVGDEAAYKLAMVEVLAIGSKHGMRLMEAFSSISLAGRGLATVAKPGTVRTALLWWASTDVLDAVMDRVESHRASSEMKGLLEEVKLSTGQSEMRMEVEPYPWPD